VIDSVELSNNIRYMLLPVLETIIDGINSHYSGRLKSKPVIMARSPQRTLAFCPSSDY